MAPGCDMPAFAGGSRVRRKGESASRWEENSEVGYKRPLPILKERAIERMLLSVGVDHRSVDAMAVSEPLRRTRAEARGGSAALDRERLVSGELGSEVAMGTNVPGEVVHFSQGRNGPRKVFEFAEWILHFALDDRRYRVRG